MAAVANFLRRRVYMFLAKRSRVQLSSGRMFLTRIHKELNCRLAKSSDFDDVVKLSRGIYNGYDFIPLVFHDWLGKKNVVIMLLYAGRRLIGLEAGCIVDGGKTLVHRAGRITPILRGQGLQRPMALALGEYVDINFPKVSRERLVTFPDVASRSVNPYRKILERDELSFFVQEKPTEKFDCHINPREGLNTDNAGSKIESCTKEYFSDVILSSAETQKLIPSNVLVFDWCPYEPLRSNIDFILEEKHQLHFFLERCSVNGGPSSFSYGVYAQTVKAEKWEATVYTDDPAVFEAHLLHQFKQARSTIEGKFTFFSVQDRIMTPFARRVLRDVLQLKEANFLKGEAMKVYERPFIRQQGSS